MAKYSKREFQVGEYWLSQREGSPAFYGTYYDADAKCTRRFSLGTDDYQEATKALAHWYLENREVKDEAPEDAVVADILRRWYDGHGHKLRSADHARTSIKHWLDFWETSTVADVRDIKRQEEFHAFLLGKMRASSANRVLAIGKSAISRAYKRGELESVPHVNMLGREPAQPRGRPMTVDELRKLHANAAEHLRPFILWMLGTAARPEAVRTLQSSQVSWEDGVINLAPQNWVQNKKRRPVVKLPASLPRFEGFLVTYKGEPVSCIKKAWGRARERAELDDKCNPYSLRHTAAKWMRRNGVSMDEVGQQLGHRDKSTAVTAIYTADDPDYLKNACAALDKLVSAVLN